MSVKEREVEKKIKQQIGNTVNHLVHEIGEHIEDLEKHRITKKNLRKVVWDKVTGTERVYDIIKDLLELETLVDSTFLAKYEDVIEIRKKAKEIIRDLGFMEEFKKNNRN